MEEVSNGDRHDRGDRRRTVSGAIPDFYNNEEEDQVSPIAAMRFPWSSPSAPTSPVTPKHPQTAPSPTKSSSSRKRSLSGSILSKLNVLRSTGGNAGGDSARPISRGQHSASRQKEPTSPTKSFFSRKSVDEDAPMSPTSPPRVEKEIGGALSAALKQSSKTRKRKGSLRKTALLGGRGIVPAGRERKGSFSLLQRTAPVAVKEQSSSVGEHRAEPQYDRTTGYPETFDDEDSAESMEARSGPQSLRHQLSYESPVAASSSDSSWTEAAAVSQARLSLLTEHHNAPSQDNGITPLAKATTNELGSPVDAKSPTSQASTTSSDDLLTFHHHHPTKPSYFPHLDTTTTTTSLLATRRRSSNKRRSPLSRTLSLSASTPYPTSPTTLEPYDYTSTSYWGWIILFATWITFVVGMGSCLGIWSWAWDVGVTPVAPPELENDETLPIVGYYPALIVLTGVVAWVWITVAWVGMKYFRHAKIEV
ncbi:hypothetical protein LTR37_008789 [Vermiconidia calcicola]|uniref:Uncharacterized protein n=1 Tax=Vermiconidia calcicola TaxID=1690605 RepID=A0ACC3NB21_9PEZI|nr:hypothetical protein LTR37_008789 [Vermiconidia calcicola]